MVGAMKGTGTVRRGTSFRGINTGREGSGAAGPEAVAVGAADFSAEGGAEVTVLGAVSDDEGCPGYLTSNLFNAAKRAASLGLRSVSAEVWSVSLTSGVESVDFVVGVGVGAVVSAGGAESPF